MWSSSLFGVTHVFASSQRGRSQAFILDMPASPTPQPVAFRHSRNQETVFQILTCSRSPDLISQTPTIVLVRAETFTLPSLCQPSKPSACHRIDDDGGYSHRDILHVDAVERPFRGPDQAMIRPFLKPSCGGVRGYRWIVWATIDAPYGSTGLRRTTKSGWRLRFLLSTMSPQYAGNSSASHCSIVIQLFARPYSSWVLPYLPSRSVSSTSTANTSGHSRTKSWSLEGPGRVIGDLFGM